MKASHSIAKEVADFLGWLNGLTCIEKHEDTCALRQAETCTWLLETEIYRSWRRGGSPFLWLEGKPGSGKSVLASSVIEELKRSRCVGEVLAFFYCDFRHERTTGAHEVMRSLLTHPQRHEAPHSSCVLHRAAPRAPSHRHRCTG
ncbi:hypothetical protein BS17DRAFT_368068 [Gyrodon lividus]|nr:hypothetical protein BS17DRAFT_368068 [Gyrodon lividus]